MQNLPSWVNLAQLFSNRWLWSAINSTCNFAGCTRYFLIIPSRIASHNVYHGGESAFASLHFSYFTLPNLLGTAAAAWSTRSAQGSMLMSLICFGEWWRSYDSSKYAFQCFTLVSVIQTDKHCCCFQI